jgi:hypothetical protein
MVFFVFLRDLKKEVTTRGEPERMAVTKKFHTLIALGWSYACFTGFLT